MSDILELIDGAIADATSSDAMRWVPEGGEAPDPVRHTDGCFVVRAIYHRRTGVVEWVDAHEVLEWLGLNWPDTPTR